MIQLYAHQEDVLDKLKNKCILRGGVGSGKSLTILAYYWENHHGKDIYVITTAKKRDDLEWEAESAKFGIGRYRDATLAGTITVDSWNNIGKYVGVKDAFFIFDEQRLVGSGSWTKSFYKIDKDNDWVMLTATPGDVWVDYIPVFVANGFYRNKTDFVSQHVIFRPFSKFPKIDRYVGTDKLERLRNDIVVDMPYAKHTERVLNWLEVDHDKDLFAEVFKKRWNPYEMKPIKDIAEQFRLMRKVVNSDPSRLAEVRNLMKIHNRLIIFYTFNYELEILRGLAEDVPLAEWNGHRKQPIPETERWVYLVQYTSGAEGWNCVGTDAMIFYSLTYSYRLFEQSQGRIDRLNSPFYTLYYYILYSDTVIDKAIRKVLGKKQNFNESLFAENLMLEVEKNG